MITRNLLTKKEILALPIKTVYGNDLYKIMETWEYNPMSVYDFKIRGTEGHDNKYRYKIKTGIKFKIPKINKKANMNVIEPRADIIKLSIIVMKSKVSVKVKEQFLLSMIKPTITIDHQMIDPKIINPNRKEV